MPLPRSVATFNRRVTNRMSRHVAGWMPGFGMVIHVGRRSGTIYETPVNVFRTPDGFAFALTYGQGDWVQNVLHAGTAHVRTRRRVHVIANPRIVETPRHERLPWPVRAVLGAIDVDEELLADDLGLVVDHEQR